MTQKKKKKEKKKKKPDRKNKTKQITAQVNYRNSEPIQKRDILKGKVETVNENKRR